MTQILPILFRPVDQFDINGSNRINEARGRRARRAPKQQLSRTSPKSCFVPPDDTERWVARLLVIEAELRGDGWKTTSVRSSMPGAVTMSGLATVCGFVPEYMG